MDYNVPIPDEQFVLEPPAGADVEDQTRGVGLSQGDLTEEEIAMEVVRQYLEALIARDYEKAGRLYNGRPAAELRQRKEEVLKIRYIRVVYVHKPERDERGGYPLYRVPFAVEIEGEDGSRVVVGAPVKSGPEGAKPQMKAMVQPVPGHPDTWTIVGGI